MTWTVFFLGTLAGTRIATATTKAILHKNLPDVKGALCGSLYRFPPQPPKFGVVACGTAGEEVIVAASALEKGLKVLLLIPPLAEASCASHLGHQVHRAEIVTELGHRYPTVDVERRLRQVVEWGRIRSHKRLVQVSTRPFIALPSYSVELRRRKRPTIPWSSAH